MNENDRTFAASFFSQLPAGCVALASVGLTTLGFSTLDEADSALSIIQLVAGLVGIAIVVIGWVCGCRNGMLLSFAGVLSLMLIVSGYWYLGESETNLVGAIFIGSGFVGLVFTAGLTVVCAMLKTVQSSMGGEQRQVKLLELIYSQSMLSDTARRVLYRERELSLLRRTIEEDVQKGDFNAALVLCQDMEKLFGYTEEADESRERVLEIRNAKHAAQIEEKIAAVHQMLERGSWRKAELAATRLHRLYPDSPKLQELEHSIKIAMEDRKRMLHSQFVSSIASGDIEQSMKVLRELDRYLSPEEAEAIRSSAQDVINGHRELLSNHFREAVSTHDWAQAIEAGERIMMEYPMDTMAAEVSEMMERLHERLEATESS